MLLSNIVLSLLFIVVAYISLAFFAIVIPVNRQFQNLEKEVVCYLSSDGIHTDFILPTTNNYFDWRALFKAANFESGIPPSSYLALGWGDRGFYLDIPTWNDLTVKVAARAMLVPSASLMHVIAFDQVPTDKKKLVEIHLSVDEYQRLCTYIYSFFSLDSNGNVIHLPGKGYTQDDNFYQSPAKYHALHTCNYWINKGLRKAGVRTSIWSPADWGIFYQLKKIRV